MRSIRTGIHSGRLQPRPTAQPRARRAGRAHAAAPEQLCGRAGPGGRGAALQDRRARRRRARDGGRSRISEPRRKRRGARRVRRDQRRASVEPRDADSPAAAPISYSWTASNTSRSARDGSRGGGTDQEARMPQTGRLVAFKLGGTATFPAPSPPAPPANPPSETFDDETRSRRRAALSRALQPLPRRQRAYQQCDSRSAALAGADEPGAVARDRHRWRAREPRHGRLGGLTFSRHRPRASALTSGARRGCYSSRARSRSGAGASAVSH